MTYPGVGYQQWGFVPGQVPVGYLGSYDQWFDQVVGDLIARYKTGEGGSGWADPTFSSPYGKPDPNDFGNPERPLSMATQRFIEEYVKNEGANSPYIQATYGAAPDRRQTFVNDPNSASAIQGTFAERSAWESGEAAKDRALTASMAAADRASREAIAAADNAVRMASIASSERIASMQEAGATQRTKMQIDASWREAQLADATRRYIAEGDWGTQRWVVETQEAGALQRLQLQLAFDREALAQQAVAEVNRHQENMISLAIQVAQYDAELASNPANLYAYAAWLQNRNVVVNGLTVAMAAQEVPPQAIDPAEVANTTGDMLAGLQQQALVSGQSGGSAQQMTAEQLQQIIAGSTGAPAGTTAQMLAGAQLPQHEASPSAKELGQTTDYTSLANELLGMNPVAPNAADVSQPNLQAIANSLNVGGNAGTAAGFGQWGGSRTNSLGVTIPQVSGQEIDARKYVGLLPTEQQGVLAGVKSVRGSQGITDFARELERSRPKSRSSGATSFA